MIAALMRFCCRVAACRGPGSRARATATRGPTRAQGRSAPDQRAPKAGDAEAGATRPAGDPGPGAPDDLTAIKGIGPAIVRKLDALGVRTYADLARADPADLAARLATRTVTRDRVRQWIAEARKRV